MWFTPDGVAVDLRVCGCWNGCCVMVNPRITCARKCCHIVLTRGREETDSSQRWNTTTGSQKRPLLLLLKLLLLLVLLLLVFLRTWSTPKSRRVYPFTRSSLHRQSCLLYTSYKVPGKKKWLFGSPRYLVHVSYRSCVMSVFLASPPEDEIHVSLVICLWNKTRGVTYCPDTRSP